MLDSGSSAVTRARAAARAASSARMLRMMNRPHPAHANGFRFRRARRLFVFVAAVLIRVLGFFPGGFKLVLFFRSPVSNCNRYTPPILNWFLHPDNTLHPAHSH